MVTEMIYALELNLSSFGWREGGREGVVWGARPAQLVRDHQNGTGMGLALFFFFFFSCPGRFRVLQKAVLGP